MFVYTKENTVNWQAIWQQKKKQQLKQPYQGERKVKEITKWMHKFNAHTNHESVLNYNSKIAKITLKSPHVKFEKRGFWRNFATKLHENGAYGITVPIYNPHTKHVFPRAFFFCGRQVALFFSSRTEPTRKTDAKNEPVRCDSSYIVLKNYTYLSSCG